MRMSSNKISKPCMVCISECFFKVWTTSVFGIPTSEFEFHSTVVDECPIDPVAKGFKGSDAEHSRLLLPQVLIGPPPERVLSKYTTRD